MHEDSLITRLRGVARALAEQDGRGIPRRAVVALADGTFDVSLHRGDPVLAVVRASGDALRSLTPRERDVAERVAAGLLNKQIAAELGIATATVKDHVHRILRKTGLPNRAAIAAAWRG